MRRPAGLASSARLPGGPGAPPYGHYDPCARSSLYGARRGSPHVRKRGPGLVGIRPALAGLTGTPRWSAARRARCVNARPHASADIRLVRRAALHLPSTLSRGTNAQTPGVERAAGRRMHVSIRHPEVPVRSTGLEGRRPGLVILRGPLRGHLRMTAEAKNSTRQRPVNAMETLFMAGIQAECGGGVVLRWRSK